MMTKNIKVLFCSPMENAGGISMWTRHLLDFYNSSIDKTVVLKWFYPKLQKKEVMADTHFFLRLIIGLMNYIPFIKNLILEFRKESYNVVHFSSSASISLLKDLLALYISRRFGVKTVIHFHFGRIPEIFSKGGWEKILISQVISKADAVIVLDKYSFDTLEKEGYENIYKLPNPISNILLEYIDRIKVERKNGELLFVGHLVESKGIFELIEACNGLSNIHLTFIGKGSEEITHALREKAGKVNNLTIDLVGVVPIYSVVEYMKSCSVFVLPTYTEGFPNVIIESMACGCPIVTTDVGAIPEMLDIESGNSHGICVKPRQVDELREAIKYMLNNKEYAVYCGENAKKRVEKLYSLPIVWAKLTDIWKSIVNQ